MKKLLLAILTLGITHSTFAQFSTSGNVTSTTNNVGIGTATPAYTLGVMGNGFHFQSTTGNHAEILLRDGSIEDPKTASDNGGWVVNYNGYYGGTYFRNFTIFNGKGAAIANFNGSNSSVGIGTGTLSPLSKLQVGSGTNNQGSLTAMFGNAASSAAVNALSLVNSAPAGSGNEVDMTFHTANNYSPTAQIGAIAEAVQPTTDMAFSTFDAPTGLTEKIRILGNGNVGIGTPLPDKKLTVNGTIHATEILVDANVPHPDYVFSKDYDLASLKDVKTYIDQNHHLPEIPSAAQVVKDGINLGEMNAKLLKKIEELTLYLIEKDKKQNTLEAMLVKQNKAIRNQQKHITALERKYN